MKTPIGLPWAKSNSDRLRAALTSVAKGLTKAYRREAKHLVRSSQTFAETQALHVALRSLMQARSAIERTVHNGQVLSSDSVISLLAEQQDRLQKTIRKEDLADHFRANAVSSLTMSLLFLAENRISQALQTGPSGGEKRSEGPQVTQISIRADALYQIHQNLFPAERMLVAGGRRDGDELEVGAIFEVTGKHSSGHVRADPDRLARALIAMDLTSTHFALWVHSHPGTGKEWTRPSSIDQKQHTDWLRDYSPNLVSAIMVQDRWIRFWGTALETGQVKVTVVGPGVIKEEPDESIYRLEY